MDDFEKFLSQSRIEELAKFDLHAIELLDDKNQSKVLDSEGKPIKKYKQYSLCLTINFGYVSRLIAGNNYEFGVNKAIIAIRCFDCKVLWNTGCFTQEIDIIHERKKEQHKSFKAELSTRAIGLSFDQGHKNTENNQEPRVWMSGSESEPQVNFRIRETENTILFGGLNEVMLGILEASDRKQGFKGSRLTATLMSIEIVASKFNGQNINSPNLEKFNLRYRPNRQRIEEIKKNLTGGLQHVESRYIGR
jgi:hypothetical protein